MKDNEIELRSLQDDLRLDLDAPEGTCSICHMVPPGEKLVLGITHPVENDRTVVVCRFCLAEFAPNLLAELEAEL